MDKHKSYRPQTIAVRGGQVRSSENEHSEAIYTSSSFVFESAQQAARLFAQQEKGNVYSRFTNPSVQTFERRLALMEGGDACVATASGMSAMLTLCMTLLKAGDHVVASRSIFGASYNLLSQLMARFGVETSFVSLTKLAEWESAIQSNTKMVFFETPSNPLMELGDIRAISDLAHAANSDIKVVVDNCFCTPVLQKPLELGADLVMHSATKSIDGQGRCVGGAIVGDAELVGEKMVGFMRTAGPSMSPFNAWVFAKALETLELRVNQSCENALHIAQQLEQHTNVSRVHYPGLDSHTQNGLCQRQQSKAGAVVSFELKGGQEAAWSVIDQVALLSRTSNLGDTRTTITHPFTTTHARWSEEDKLRAGITPSLVRIAVGLEHPDDIFEDLVL